jgi:peptidoglycan hydrolase CwlO-like protein
MKHFFVTKRIRTAKTALGIMPFAVFVLLALVFSPVAEVFAQTAGSSQLTTAQSEKAQLEAQLAALQAEIAQKQQDLKGQQGQSQSLSNDIAILKTKISKSKLDITAKNLVITQLSGEITQKSDQIETLSEKIASEKESLAQLIRNTHDLDQSTVIDLILSKNSISDFYSDVNTYNSIKLAIKNSVDQILGLKSDTETAKQLLQQKQDQEMNAKAAIQQNQKQIEANQAQQNQLLSISKNKEKEYQAVLADRAAKVAQIQARLFSLAGGGAAIPFSTALTYAKAASTQTGVDPAFLLAILTQESNLGSNVGKCYLSDTSSGAGVSTSGKTFPNVMKPSRDIPPFLEITSRLGLDPLKTAVSCPIPSAGGYGGAMGPAQFIASTWKLFVSRLKTALGHDANPWAAGDAFMASGMYLGDLGASGGTYSSEIRAACKYYGTGGASCGYGTSVMKLAASIQTDIDYLNQYGVSRR